MSDLTPLARLLEHHDQRTSTYESNAEALVADPALLDALAAAGVLRERERQAAAAPTNRDLLVALDAHMSILHDRLADADRYDRLRGRLHVLLAEWEADEMPGGYADGLWNAARDVRYTLAEVEKGR